VIIPNPVQESVWLELSLMDFRPDARLHSDEDLAKLAKSMSVRQIYSIIVCKNGDRYEVIAGVGRILVGRMLSWDKIRADIYEGLTETQKLSLMFDENEDREDPPALYQAKVLKNLIETEKQATGQDNIPQDKLAEMVGKDQATVSRYLALFKLSPLVWKNYARCIKLGAKHFVQILRIESEDEQWKLTETTLEKDLTSEELKKIVDKKLGVSKGGRPKKSKSLGDVGFEVKRRKDTLTIRGVLPLAEDPAAFMARLNDEILRQRSLPTGKAGPLPAASQAGNGAEKVPVSAAS